MERIIEMVRKICDQQKEDMGINGSPGSEGTKEEAQFIKNSFPQILIKLLLLFVGRAKRILGS
jgi:hypothetical protein